MKFWVNLLLCFGNILNGFVEVFLVRVGVFVIFEKVLADPTPFASVLATAETSHLRFGSGVSHFGPVGLLLLWNVIFVEFPCANFFFKKSFAGRHHLLSDLLFLDLLLLTDDDPA